MSAETTIASVEHEGFTVTSTGTAADIKESLQSEAPAEAPDEKADISKAASEMGKKGGEAAAKARKAAEKEARKAKPIPDKKEGKRDGGGSTEEVRPSGEDAGRVDGGDDSLEAGAGEDATAAESKRDNPRHDAQARIRELAEERRAERARAERAESEAREYRYRLEQAERERQRPAQEAPAPSPPQGKPQSSDFETYEEYLDARDKWNRDQWTQETTQRFQIHQAATAHVQKVIAAADAWNAAMAKGAEADPEFLDKISQDIKDLGPSFMLEPGQRPGPRNWFADELLSISQGMPEKAPTLALYLSEHPAEFQRIVALQSPRAITRELTILSVKLSDAATAGPSAERRASKANPPPTPVGGSPSIAGGNETPKPGEDFDSWLRRQKAR